MSAPGGKRLVNSKSGLKIVCQHDKDASPWELAEPQWTPDQEVLNCVGCQGKFNMFNRRHHCRRCGQIFCNSCCSNKVQLHRMAFVDPVRLCQPCSEVTKEENDFFTNQIKVLFEGAPFHVSVTKSPLSSPDTPLPPIPDSLGSQMPKLFFCKLTSDQRFLMFQEHDDDDTTQADEDLVEPLEVAKILEMKPILDDKYQSGSLCLRVKLNGTEELSLRLDSPPEPSRKPSVKWITALRRGLDMVMETKEESGE